METLEEINKAIERKFEMIKFTHEDTNKAIEKGNLSGMERQKKTLECKVEEIHELKVKIQELKFERGEQAENIRKWSDEVDDRVAVFDDAVSTLEKCVKEAKRNEIRETRKQEDMLAARARQEQFEEQLKFDQAKFDLKLQYEKKLEEGRKTQARENKGNTKFNGTHADWLRFWNQFNAEIDAADVAPVTKFSYLRELVDPKVRVAIDGLPFTTEGYERAKNILKSRYGKQSEIVNAYVQNIMSLPIVSGSQPAKIHAFYEKLVSNVQSLQTLGKLTDVNGYVRMTIDKLEGIRGDLVRTDDDWQEWDFPRLTEALRKWTERNPNKLSEKVQEKYPHVRGKSFQVKQEESKHPKGCVYCEETDHKSVNCQKVVTIADRKKQLSLKQLCFNCTGSKHRAADCRSRSGCQRCQRRHHTSICDRASEQLMTTTCAGKGAVTYPVVVVEVNGIKCRALLDTGAGSSYASSTLLDRLQIRPLRKEFKRIEMMLGAANKMIGIYGLTINSVDGNFNLETEVTKVDRGVLLTLENPKYKEMIAKFPHLNGVTMDDETEKPELPVHLILGTSEYTKIKTETTPRVGSPGEPVAEFTRFGWTIMSPGKEVDLSNMFLTQTATADYEALCRLDILGLKDAAIGDQETVYHEFKEQLTRSPEGWYETRLPWKGNHPPLSNNKTGSLKRLNNLVRKLEKQNILEEYNNIIQDQLSQGIVELAEEKAEGREFYIPHKAVVREAAETTKIRIVYDASARASEKAPSLNECLETGPQLQNLLWSVLVRNRFHPVAIAGDLKQAFLQVRICEVDRDAMRFHWFKDLETKETETLRFTRALFGLAPSPFLLGGVIKEHLRNCKTANPMLVEEIKRSLYVDDLISGGETTDRAMELKHGATTIFGEATFELHKWHSNEPALEAETPPVEEEQSYAKQHLGVKRGESKLLGLPWDKKRDTIQVNFPTQAAEPSKRGILGKIAKVYDPLGLVSPLTLSGKMLYRDACDIRVAWDTRLPGDLISRWLKWERNLPDRVVVPRSLARFREVIQSIDLHAFGDASGQGVSAAVFAVVQQPSGTNQGLVAAKSRLAKKGLTIPRLELVSGHMATNLLHNVKEALQGFPVRDAHCWLDSTVALHWIRGNGDYKQFVGNRVQKIQEKAYIKWRHVGTEQNPADLGSRGGDVNQTTQLWWRGPEWLSEPANWPADIITSATKETKAEAKTVKELFAVAQQVDDKMDQLVGKWDVWKAIRIGAWVSRFTHNTRNRTNKISGPLTAEETSKQVQFWVKRVQSRNEETDKFQEDKLQLNLQRNDQGVYQCRGRIQGDYPTYLPENEVFTEKLVQNAHLLTLHGGVGLTMAKIREQYWVPRLRRLTKRVIKQCHGCKRFQAIAFANPPTGNLPRDRTEGSTPFQVVGADYAGPIKYRTKTKREAKAYIILYACSLTRGLYLELLPNLGTEEFLRSLKRLIARRGRPAKIYSDNGKTFVAAAKWLKQVMKDEQLHNWLATQNIQWQFNLSRAPWWGGQFERMVGLVKQSLYKTIGNGYLTWSELQDVLLDVEVTLNNRPLSYVEDDVQLPLLTPNALLFGQPNQIPEEDDQGIQDPNLRKRAKYLRRCKDAMWGRWSSEYLKALRERHNLKHDTKQTSLQPGDVVLIKSEDRNRGKWKIGIVDKLICGRDGVTRAARLRAGKSYLERAVQHLYPMELSCDRTTAEQPTPLNADASEFTPKRKAGSAARERIRAIANDEE